MWSSRRPTEPEEPVPGIRERLSAAWTAARELVATRVEILKEEASQKGSRVARGAFAFTIALALAWLALLLLTALIAALLARLFGSTWAGLLGTLIVYLIGAAGAAWAGLRAFRNFRLFDFPETRRGLREDWNAVRGALEPPPDRDDDEDLEQRFRTGSE